MASFSGPEIRTSNLVFNFDAANPKNFGLSSVEVLVVAGGGSGGVDNGGGGGAGGVIHDTNYSVTPGTSYTVTIGAGGAARAGPSDDGPGNNGSNSSFGSLTAIGGGGGSGWTNTTLPPGTSSYSGGSGAGQSASTSSGNSLGAGSATSGQGNIGGSAIPAYAGGGGGRRSRGGNGSIGAVGSGGHGIYSNITGNMACYAAGGAGGFDAVNGYSSILPFTENGTVKKLTQTNEDSCASNTGHGGNGANHNNWNSGAGGSGIVVVRYLGPQRATGGTVTKSGNYTIHTFTSSGTFLPLRIPNNAEAINSITDVTGNNFVTAINSPAYNSSGYITFNGSNQYLNAGSIDLQRNFTLEIWAYITGDVSGLFGQGTGAQSQGLHVMWYYQGNRGMIFGMYGNDLDTPSYTLTYNTWHHFVFTYNHSTYLKQFYADGTLINSGTYSAYSGSGNLIIGDTYSGGNVPAKGNISVARIYGSVLSVSDINMLFQASRDRYGV